MSDAAGESKLAVADEDGDEQQQKQPHGGDAEMEWYHWHCVHCDWWQA